MRIRFLAPKRWRFLVGPCGEGFARSNEGALSSTGSAWVCCVVYTNSVPFQAHHAKKHMKITQRCDESSCQILKMIFNRMDIDIDSDTPDEKKRNSACCAQIRNHDFAQCRDVTMTFAHPCDKSFRRMLTSSNMKLTGCCLCGN